MKTVLIVDDSIVDRKLVGSAVQKIGCNTIYASNGQEAMEILQREQPDLILSDVQMPVMDGLELVEQVRRSHPQVPVILMTAFGNEELAGRALRAGASSYVPKKQLRQDIDEAIRNVMATVDAARQRDEVRSLLEESTYRFVLGYEPDGPQALVSYLQDGLSRMNFCDQSTLLQLATALTEALSNAIDHGNLELESKLRKSNFATYCQLRNERAMQTPYRDRRVRVTATFTPSEAKFVVLDEGHGFDPTSLPNPTDPDNLLEPTGRGVLLMRTFMDVVTFNEVANEVTMIKRRSEHS